MPAEDGSGARPPVVLRIKLRYDDLETMVARFASNVGKNGLFLPTKSLQPVGAEVKFELRLANDTPVLVGLGRVKHVRPPDPANPKATFGMAIELMRVTRESREVIIRMIERRRALGLPEVAIPMPEDAEAARRSEVESQPRADTSGIVREAMAQLASAPVSEQVLAPATRDSGAIAVAKSRDSGPVPRATTGSEASLSVSAPIVVARETSAGAITRDSGAIARPTRVSEPAAAVAPLAAEAPRAKRPRIADVIAKANELSGPLAAAPLPGLEDATIDVAKVIARARVLAQAAGAGDLEAELAALKDASAAPVEISVEGASAELARQLGGASIAKRERSARWEPPPAVKMPERVVKAPEPVVKAPEPVAPEPAATEPAPAPEPERPPPTRTRPRAHSLSSIARRSAPAPIVAPEPAATEVQPHEPELEEQAAPHDTPTVHHMAPAPPKPSTAVRPMMIDDNADLQAFEAALDAARIHTGVAQAAPPAAQPEPDDEPIAPPAVDEEPVEQLDSLDMEPVSPSEEAEHTMIGGVPADQADLAYRLDAQLEAAEAEAEAEIAEMRRQPQDPYAAAASEYQQVARYPQTYEQGDYPPQYAEDQYPQEGQGEYHDAGAVPQYVPAPGEFEDDEPSEEISDVDVLAEADEGDADLLESQPHAAPYEEPPPAREPGSFDYAARLDLGDDEPQPQEFDDPHGFEKNTPYPQRRAASYPRQSSDYDPPSGGYTVAESFPQEGEDFDEPHAFSQRATPQQPYHRDSDLENALEQLDVDLDDISARDKRPRLPGLPVPHPDPATDHPTARPAPRMHSASQPPKPRRLPTDDDGVLIDFDDDD